MPCRNGSDGSTRPRRAEYRPLPASRDARGNASTGLPTTRGTASAPASLRGSTTGYRWRSGSATATGTTIASSPQSVPFPSQTSASYPPRKREEPEKVLLMKSMGNFLGSVVSCTYSLVYAPFMKSGSSWKALLEPWPPPYEVL